MYHHSIVYTHVWYICTYIHSIVYIHVCNIILSCTHTYDIYVRTFILLCKYMYDIYLQCIYSLSPLQWHFQKLEAKLEAKDCTSLFTKKLQKKPTGIGFEICLDLLNMTLLVGLAVHVWYVQQKNITHCNTLQHTATHCNTLQHTATHCGIGCTCMICTAYCIWNVI